MEPRIRNHNLPVQSGHGNAADTVGRKSQAYQCPDAWQMYKLAGILLKSLLTLHCGVQTVPPSDAACVQARRPFNGGSYNVQLGPVIKEAYNFQSVLDRSECMVCKERGDNINFHYTSLLAFSSLVCLDSG